MGTFDKKNVPIFLCHIKKNRIFAPELLNIIYDNNSNFIINN